MKKSFSLAVKKLLAIIMFLLLSLSGLQAAGFISGAELREQLTSYLAEQGLTSKPALDNARQFRACISDLHFSPYRASKQLKFAVLMLMAGKLLSELTWGNQCC